MNNWPIFELDKVCIKITVGFVGSMVDEYVDEGVLFLRSQNILPFNLNLDSNQVKFISNDFDKKISKSKLYPGDIAIVRTGYPGTACVIPEGFEDLNCSDLVIVRPNNSKINSDYLCNYINSPFGKGAIFGSLVGVAQQHFNVGVAKKMKIKLPPLAIQQKIASILSAYDELIENNKQRIKLLEEMAEEIYKEWFVRLRFPDYENTKIVDGLPECWEKVKIDDYIKFEKGIEPGSDNYSSEKIDDNYLPFLRVGDLGSRDNSIFVHKDFLKGKILSKEDIAITLDGSVGLVAMNLSGGYSSGVRKIVYKKIKIKRSFIYLTLLSENIQGTIKAHAAGTTILHAGSSINFMRILLPDEIILVKFEEIVNPMIEEILLLKEKIQHLKETRDLLLPRLISGKLSVTYLVDEELSMAAAPAKYYK